MHANQLGKFMDAQVYIVACRYFYDKYQFLPCDTGLQISHQNCSHGPKLQYKLDKTTFPIHTLFFQFLKGGLVKEGGAWYNYQEPGVLNV